MDGDGTISADELSHLMCALQLITNRLWSIRQWFPCMVKVTFGCRTVLGEPLSPAEVAQVGHSRTIFNSSVTSCFTSLQLESCNSGCKEWLLMSLASPFPPPFLCLPLPRSLTALCYALHHAPCSEGGLSSRMMALITSDCGAMSSLKIKMALITLDCRCLSAPTRQT